MKKLEKVTFTKTRIKFNKMSYLLTSRTGPGALIYPNFCPIRKIRKNFRIYLTP